ncbi:hypothetical protein TcWFU_009267 [Taenia crassiceps]|uniref:Uncharacterized protein n=1 Tax=Taenia crassiceps TaxID=6207 RepID=A0ABR4QMM8_9CEST
MPHWKRVCCYLARINGCEGNTNFASSDTPPGTGDVHLTLIQNIPIVGSVVVTTSHPLSLSNTQRGIEMLLKLNVPLLGVVENMAHFVCPSCKLTTPLWRAADSTGGGAGKLADEYGIPLLCQIPFEPNVLNGNEKKLWKHQRLKKRYLTQYANLLVASVNLPENADGLSRRLGEMVVDDVIKGVTRLESTDGFNVGRELNSSDYISACSEVPEHYALDVSNLDTDLHLSSCGEHVIKPSLPGSDLKILSLEHRAISCKTGRCKKRHHRFLENPFWASRLNRGVRFDDRGRVVAITDVICPRQRVDAATKVPWNLQTNKSKTKYS